MDGVVKSYLSEKEYGFILGDDGKSYFFHQKDFIDKNQLIRLSDGALVSFDQTATRKGYRAINCALIDQEHIKKYTVPSKFIMSKKDTVLGWNIFEYGDWIIQGCSNTSLDNAKIEISNRARRIGANGIINLEYHPTTGIDGNYRYTIHRFKGRPVFIANKDRNGELEEKDLGQVNLLAQEIKDEITAINSQVSLDRLSKKIFWGLLFVGALIYSFDLGMVVLAMFLIVSIFSKRMTYAENWLDPVEYIDIQ